MRFLRFFIDQPLAENAKVEIEGKQAHYIKNVLRLKSGESITLFNGKGGEFSAVIRSVDRSVIHVDTGQFIPNNRGLDGEVTLGIAVIKRDAMDFAIQKSIEVGVTKIQPLMTERVSVPQKQIHSRLDHWRGIAINSCEQCGANLIPEVAAPMTLDEWMPTFSGLKLYGNPEAKRDGAITPSKDGAHILVGPEGGFSDDEVERINAHGFRGVNLGERILRAETAAVSLLTLVNQSRLKSH